MDILLIKILAEMYLYHGTSKTPPEQIYQHSEEGFDIRYAGEGAKAGMWGAANYFAVNASYSDKDYVYEMQDGTRQLLFARVLIGNATDK